MLKWIAGAVAALIVAVGVLLYGMAYGWYGTSHNAGTIESKRQPDSVLLDRAAKIARAREQMGLPVAKQVLFGDLHTHTTYSIDAYFMSLPMTGGKAIHPISDACDYARYCSALDFWSINDHVEGMTPRQWKDTKESIRQCNATAGDPKAPDLVAFLGWEWTQIGTTPKNHYGHKNVILRDTDEDKVPTRPIAAAPPADGTAGVLNFGPPPYNRMMMSLAAPDGARERYLDFATFVEERSELAICPTGVPVRDLPADCLEMAATPHDLYAKLNDWGFPAMVIPHGTTWGLYTPAGSTIDKQLTPEQNDPNMVRLFEIYSGHGNSEEYRTWQAVTIDADGKSHCAEPTKDYLPSCWRAGEIIRERCKAANETDATCEAWAVEARQNYVDAGVAGQQTVVGARPDDWLDAGQCRDCDVPAMNYRPGNSAQYALAIRNFETPAPMRYTFGFIGSSDNHSARPGTGFKEVNRFENTEGGGAPKPGSLLDPVPNLPAPQPRSVAFDRANSDLQNFQLAEFERQTSFFMTGGLVAVHAEGRSREEIWDALQRRETYATSGDRMLLWFDLENGGTPGAEVKAPMGSEVEMSGAPRFTVRASGAFKQKPGCPEQAVTALSPERLNTLCEGECYNPSDVRKLITRIEVVRIRPQISKDEPVANLIEDVWRSIPCEANPEGCTVTFEDPEFATVGRDTIYYVRAIEEPSDAINAGGLRCEKDAEGNCIKVNICRKDYRTDREDDCLEPFEERAWSSPIFVNYVQPAEPVLTPTIPE